jgi:hypothetical protein
MELSPQTGHLIGRNMIFNQIIALLRSSSSANPRHIEIALSPANWHQHSESQPNPGESH